MSEEQSRSEQESLETRKAKEIASALLINSRASLAQADYLTRLNNLSYFGDLPKINMIRLYAALAEKAGLLQDSGEDLSVEGFSPLSGERIWAKAVLIRAKGILLGEEEKEDERPNSYYQNIFNGLEKRMLLGKDSQRSSKKAQGQPNFLFALAEAVRTSLAEDLKVEFPVKS